MTIDVLLEDATRMEKDEVVALTTAQEYAPGLDVSGVICTCGGEENAIGKVTLPTEFVPVEVVTVIFPDWIIWDEVFEDTPLAGIHRDQPDPVLIS